MSVSGAPSDCECQTRMSVPVRRKGASGSRGNSYVSVCSIVVKSHSRTLKGNLYASGRQDDD